MKNEDGFNDGVKRIGTGVKRIGTLALWSIPASLGVAAILWIGAYMQAHNFFRQLSQEQRRAVYVGAAVPPTGPYHIELPNMGCIKIDRADLDGSTLALYFHNSCKVEVRFVEFTWDLISPDGTKLESGQEYSVLCGGPGSLSYGEKGEAVLSGDRGITIDSRASKIRVQGDK